jgi:DNA polymerase
MISRTIKDFDHWRNEARRLIADSVAPHDVQLHQDDGQQLLFGDIEQGDAHPSQATPKQTFSVTQAFLSLAQAVSYHRHPKRWDLLYRVLWRITNDHPRLLEISTDDDVMRLNQMEKQVRRDAHKMKAFVRFRRIMSDQNEQFIAWHRPDHRIVRKVAPFFSRRFKGMNWAIFTPDESVVWDQKTLTYGKGVPRRKTPQFDELEELWKTYYRSIFNPARVKVKMMKSEMPVRYWDTMPESELIAELLLEAPRRVDAMIEQHEGFGKTALDFFHIDHAADLTLESLKHQASRCQACDLYKDATATVFGVGPADAKIVILGEQPGDQEDIAGQPFVGPAGQLLDQALKDAGLSRSDLYLTNIVKHFNFTHTVIDGQQRRLHKKPGAREVRCCRPWFDAEWSLLTDAQVLVCLGATAAKAIIDPGFKISRQRGEPVATDYCKRTIATWHPSAILRSATVDDQRKKREQLTYDLRVAANGI